MMEFFNNEEKNRWSLCDGERDTIESRINQANDRWTIAAQCLLRIAKIEGSVYLAEFTEEEVIDYIKACQVYTEDAQEDAISIFYNQIDVFAKVARRLAGTQSGDDELETEAQV